MKPALQSLLKPVKHLEFTGPGALALVVAAAFLAAAVISENHWETWSLAALLLACGVCLLFRSIIGTILMIGLLCLLVAHGIPKLQFSGAGLGRAFLGVVFLLAMITQIVEQIKFHRSRRKLSHAS